MHISRNLRNPEITLDRSIKNRNHLVLVHILTPTRQTKFIT